jgi:hypothetical protein
MENKTNIIKKRIKECECEIEWAGMNIDTALEPGNPFNFSAEESMYFTTWLDAHTEILKICKGE